MMDKSSDKTGPWAMVMLFGTTAMNPCAASASHKAEPPIPVRVPHDAAAVNGIAIPLSADADDQAIWDELDRTAMTYSERDELWKHFQSGNG